MRYRILNTFTGPFVLMQHDSGEISAAWVNPEVQLALASSKRDPRLQPELAARLTAYFAGDAVDFTDVPLPRGSKFFQACWKACRRIPRGQTRTYAELAELAGSTAAAARAAGQAMRHNPLPIITPCHRVIGSAGKLHGFGGSCDAHGMELATKRALLEMEGAAIDPKSPSRRTTGRAGRLLATAAG